MRWMMLSLKECETTLGKALQETIDEIHRLIHSQPENSPHLLHLLWKHIVILTSPHTPEFDDMVQMRILVSKMAEIWQQYTLFLTESGVPTTNNATERAIARWRTHNKTARGLTD
jgi:hypothetical protein